MLSHHRADCLVTAVVTVKCTQTIVNTPQNPNSCTKSNLLIECRPRRLELAHDTPTLGVMLVNPRTVEVHELLRWPHHAQALGNTQQRVVCHCNGRKQTRSRRVWIASGVRRGCLRRICHVFSILTTTAIRSDHSHSSYSFALCLLRLCVAYLKSSSLVARPRPFGSANTDTDGICTILGDFARACQPGERSMVTWHTV